MDRFRNSLQTLQMEVDLITQPVGAPPSSHNESSPAPGAPKKNSSGVDLEQLLDDLKQRMEAIEANTAHRDSSQNLKKRKKKSDDENKFNTALTRFFNKFIGCDERNPSKIPDPPTDASKKALIAQFNEAMESGSKIEIPKNMVPDWCETADSLYNRLVRSACTTSFLTEVAKDWRLGRIVHPDFCNEEQCEQWLLKRLKTLRRDWKELNEPDPEAKRAEKAKKSIIKARTGTLRHARIITASEIESPHYSILDYHGTELHSDDEDDGSPRTRAHAKTYKVFRVEWRSYELTNFFLYLDALYPRLRSESGNAIRKRTRPLPELSDASCTDFSGCKAPTGLPVNYYRREFLASLSKVERMLLKPKPAIPFDKH